MEEPRKPIREMIKEAVTKRGGVVSYAEIREYIRQHYPGTNESSINAQIIECSVNQPSRIHYPSNQKPRVCNDPRYDFLYSVDRGKVVLYDPGQHGVWEIVEEGGRFRIHQRGVEEEPAAEDDAAPEKSGFFALESHLRDYLALNLDAVEPGLTLYRDESGREGIEYPTDVGYIDILAAAGNGDFVVFELKVGRGPDATCGQLLRYMGWVRRHLANGRDVRGVIVAHRVTQNLLYAASEHPGIRVYEYDLSFTLREPEHGF